MYLDSISQFPLRRPDRQSFPLFVSAIFPDIIFGIHRTMAMIHFLNNILQLMSRSVLPAISENLLKEGNVKAVTKEMT